MMKLNYKLTGIVACILVFCLCFAGSQTLSGNLASDLITRARSLTNSNSDYSMWSDDEFLAWLNDGQAYISRQTSCLQATESINIVADQSEYDVTADYVNIQIMQYIDATPKTYGMVIRNPTDFNTVTAGTRPMYWFDWGEKVSIWPVPTASEGSIKLFYIPRLTRLSATTSAITIPAIYEEVLLKYMVSEAWKKDRQFAKANQYKAEYDAEIKFLSGKFLNYKAETPK